MLRVILKSIFRLLLKLLVKLIDCVLGDGKGFWCWTEGTEPKINAEFLGGRTKNAFLVDGVECRLCLISSEGPYANPAGGDFVMAYLSRSVCKKICDPRKCW